MSHIPEDRHKHGLVLDYTPGEQSGAAALLAAGVPERRLHPAETQSANMPTSSSTSTTSAAARAARDHRAQHVRRQPAKGHHRPRDRQGPQAARWRCSPPAAWTWAPSNTSTSRSWTSATAGKAVLLVSLELDEVMNLSDRILVMYEGEIVGEFDPKKTTVQELGLYMAGARKQGKESRGNEQDETAFRSGDQSSARAFWLRCCASFPSGMACWWALWCCWPSTRHTPVATALSRIVTGRRVHDAPYGVGKVLATQPRPLIMTRPFRGLCLQDRPVQHRCRRSVHAGRLRCPVLRHHAQAALVRLPAGCGHAGRRIWGAIPGFFKAYFNVNEVITSIMFNWIGLYLVN